MAIKRFGAIPTSEIQMLENKYNVELPHDYFEFLRSVGGGIVEQADNEIYVEGLADNISVDVIYGVNTGHQNANIDLWTDKYRNEMPIGTIIIGDTLEHGFIVLLCSGEDAGIYYWDDTYHFACSNDDSNTYFVADTFSQFIKGFL